jgi:hypothetical protein
MSRMPGTLPAQRAEVREHVFDQCSGRIAAELDPDLVIDGIYFPSAENTSSRLPGAWLYRP